MNAKKILFILLSLVFATGVIVFNACSKEEEAERFLPSENPEFQLGQLDINVLATAGTYAIAVTGNVKWAVAVNANAAAWCTVAPASGEGNGTIIVSITDNDTGKARKAAIAAKAAYIDEQQTVSLTQHSYAPYLSVSKDTVNATFVATADTITLFSTQDWRIIRNQADNWYTLAEDLTGTAGSGRLIVNLETNTGDSRKATFTVHTPDADKTIVVMQQATTFQLDISPATFSVVPVGGSQLQVNLTANTPWHVESNATWCTPNPAAGNSNQQVTLTIPANTGTYKRTAILTFTGEGIQQEITLQIEQAGTAAEFVFVANPTVNATPTFEKYQILVESNVAWTAAKDAANWYSITPASGTDNGTVTVTMLGYHPTQTQSATITIAPQNAAQGEPQTVSLNATYEGVEFNGVIWAPTAVDDPGVFVPAIGKPGKLYQFSKNIPWYSGISVLTPDWWGRDCDDPVNRGNNDWDEVNQPVCPEGWQMPSYDQLFGLVGYEILPDATQNGYQCQSVRNGLLYFSRGRTDCRYNYPADPTQGPDYSFGSGDWSVWTKTSVSGAYAWGTRGSGGYTNWDGAGNGNKTRGQSIRCVKK